MSAQSYTVRAIIRQIAIEHPLGNRQRDEGGTDALVLGEGDTVGCCHSLMGSGRVQVDNFLTSSDIDTDSDNEETMQDILLYPGETDTELPCEDGLIIRNTCLEMHCTPDLQPTAHEHHGDDIQPFSLDPDFDYGSVALTPKLSSLELDFLNDRTNQKAEEVHT
ncbi:intraflagellar transport-associated protein [Gastrophryne carolinensis]